MSSKRTDKIDMETLERNLNANKESRKFFYPREYILNLSLMYEVPKTERAAALKELEAARLLMDGDTDFEFRTTVVRGLHTSGDFADIAAWLPGSEKYFRQAFKDSGNVISGGCSAFTRGEMDAFRDILLPAIPNTEIRGMD